MYVSNHGLKCFCKHIRQKLCHEQASKVINAKYVIVRRHKCKKRSGNMFQCLCLSHMSHLERKASIIELKTK